MISKKRAPHTPDTDMLRIVQQIYDDLNELINAVNQFTSVGNEGRGKPGNIRVTDKGLEYRDKTGWHRVTDA